MSATEIIEIDTPRGPARLFVDHAVDRTAAAQPGPVLVLGHGAGGGVTAADLSLLAATQPEIGTTVVRFEQPWRTAGRKVATPPAHLDEGWHACIDAVLASEWGSGPLFFGGRSAGARVACRTAPAYPVVGVVCLAFPLHLPGQPQKSRIAELLTPAVPRLVLQGTRDTFGSAAEITESVGTDLLPERIRLVELPGADHGYKTLKAAAFTPAMLRERLVTSVAAFVAELAPPD